MKSKRKNLSKAFLGVSGAAALGMALGGAASAQSKVESGKIYTNQAVRANPQVKQVTSDEFTKRFQLDMTAEEAAAWSEDANVKKASEILLSLGAAEQIKFIGDPNTYVAKHGWFGDFGISAGQPKTNAFPAKLGAIVKIVRSGILDKMATSLIFED